LKSDTLRINHNVSLGLTLLTLSLLSLNLLTLFLQIFQPLLKLPFHSESLVEDSEE